jgi:hypothetical protein
MSLINWIDFQSLSDQLGSLVAVEIGVKKSVLFDIRGNA